MNGTKRQWRLLSLFHLYCLLLLGLSAYVRSLPPTPDPIPAADSWEARWWGLWPITYLPAPFYWSGLALIGVAIVAAQWYSLAHNRNENLNDRSLPPTRNALRLPVVLLVACGCILCVLFYLFPIVHTRWGDAYILSRSIAWPDADLRLTHSWQAPLDVRLHSIVWQQLGPRFAWSDAMPVYRLLSPVAGAVYLTAGLALAQNDRRVPPWLSFGLLGSLGLVQLFFGYVENYSFAAAGVLLYLYLGLETIRKQRPLWQAALLLAITNALHPSTVVLTPSLLIGAWHYSRRDSHSSRNNFWRVLVIEVAAPFVLIAGATFFMMEAGGHGLQALLTSDRPGGSDARWFVPLRSTTTRWEHYTLFSWRHLRDMINLQLLVAPIVLPSLGITVASCLLLRQHQVATQVRSVPARSATAVIRFLLTAVVAYLVFIWTWNPDYGGQRDWDLFSLFAIPSTLLLLVLLPRIIPARTRMITAMGPLLLFQILHTVAWIYQNTLPWDWP